MARSSQGQRDLKLNPALTSISEFMKLHSGSMQLTIGRLLGEGGRWITVVFGGFVGTSSSFMHSTDGASSG